MSDAGVRLDEEAPEVLPMGSLWVILFIIGTMAPTLVVVASAWLVGRLAGRLRGLVPWTRPPWHWVLGHLALIMVVEGGSAVIMGLMAPQLVMLVPSGLAVLSMLVVPMHLYRSVRAASARHPEEGAHTVDTAAGDGPMSPIARKSWGIAGLMASTGVLLPWMVGLGVKIYLDSRGMPTLPVSDFLDPRALPVLVFQTLLLWAFPFVILASAIVVPWRVGFGKDPRGRESMLPIWTAYVAGVLADVLLFIGIFWEFDAIMLLVPLGVYVLPPMLIGYFIGWWVVVRGIRTGSRSRSPTRLEPH